MYYDIALFIMTGLKCSIHLTCISFIYIRILSYFWNYNFHFIIIFIIVYNYEVYLHGTKNFYENANFVSFRNYVTSNRNLFFIKHAILFISVNLKDNIVNYCRNTYMKYKQEREKENGNIDLILDESTSLLPTRDVRVRQNWSKPKLFYQTLRS